MDVAGEKVHLLPRPRRVPFGFSRKFRNVRVSPRFRSNRSRPTFIIRPSTFFSFIRKRISVRLPRIKLPVRSGSPWEYYSHRWGGEGDGQRRHNNTVTTILPWPVARIGALKECRRATVKRRRGRRFFFFLFNSESCLNGTCVLTCPRVFIITLIMSLWNAR